VRAASLALLGLASVPLARGESGKGESGKGALLAPVSPACVSSPFGPRDAVGPRASRFHNGIDLPAPAGAWVRAAAAGQVAGIRRRGASGLEVTIRHADGTMTRYAHLGMVAPALATGQRMVAQGDRLGRIGRTGITYGTHLHLEVLVNGVPVDPARYFDIQPCDRTARR
jgi:murein DD-endopeptidase MepM/ murein hydrolase activator NlpD